MYFSAMYRMNTKDVRWFVLLPRGIFCLIHSKTLLCHYLFLQFRTESI